MRITNCISKLFDTTKRITFEGDVKKWPNQINWIYAKRHNSSPADSNVYTRIQKKIHVEDCHWINLRIWKCFSRTLHRQNIWLLWPVQMFAFVCVRCSAVQLSMCELNRTSKMSIAPKDSMGFWTKFIGPCEKENDSAIVWIRVSRSLVNWTGMQRMHFINFPLTIWQTNWRSLQEEDETKMGWPNMSWPNKIYTL